MDNQETTPGPATRFSLRPALPGELPAAESMSRDSMASYRATRGVAWDTERFRQSWRDFENLAIVEGSQCRGFIRLMPEGEALAIRDLQVDPAFRGRGIGSWSIMQAMEMAASRGYRSVRLRVYPENPAMALYSRLGFEVDHEEDSVVHMHWRRALSPDAGSCASPSDGPPESGATGQENPCPASVK
ncbi:GNAT family N-acetyltransferase [Arenimonas sp.]|uniref:GNAT family N-acetyltransferase n=1 Tax=Arenimonas sp. TaxID=1872635 RepID=UPI002E3791C2|nr:GNAT family N-acetyltransferase [Arenimonas sp.]HEX4854771.1 GNAT family N-acetyltransferase [Arenimonas sp.]